MGMKEGTLKDWLTDFKKSRNTEINISSNQ